MNIKRTTGSGILVQYLVTRLCLRVVSKAVVKGVL